MSEEAEEIAAGSEEDAKTKRLTPAQWTAICTRFELGTITVSEIMSEYGITKQAILKHFRKNKIVRGSRKSELRTVVAATAAATTAAAVTTPTFADKRKSRIEETKEEHYIAANYLSKLVMKLVSDAQKAGKPMSTLKGDLQALRFASAIQEQSFEIRMDLLGARLEIDENELPTFTIDNLSERDIEEMRNKQEEDDMGDEALMESVTELGLDEDDEDE